MYTGWVRKIPQLTICIIFATGGHILQVRDAFNPDTSLNTKVYNVSATPKLYNHTAA